MHYDKCCSVGEGSINPGQWRFMVRTTPERLNQLAKHWAKEIKAGVFPSFKTGKKPSGVSREQFRQNHPSNVAARKAHRVIDQDMANFRSGRRGRNKASLLRRWADNKRK